MLTPTGFVRVGVYDRKQYDTLESAWAAVFV